MTDMIDILPENSLTTLKGYVDPALMYWEGQPGVPGGQDGERPTRSNIGNRRPTRLIS